MEWIYCICTRGMTRSEMCYFSDDGLWLYIYLVIYQQQQHMEVPEARS